MDHTRGRLKLIFDRRPQNGTEELMGQWIDLPSRCQLVCQTLDAHETLRGSGQDLENYFYALAHEDNWIPKNAVGRRLRGADFMDLGAPSAGYLTGFVFGWLQ